MNMNAEHELLIPTTVDVPVRVKDKSATRCQRIGAYFCASYVLGLIGGALVMKTGFNPAVMLPTVMSTSETSTSDKPTLSDWALLGFTWTSVAEAKPELVEVVIEPSGFKYQANAIQASGEFDLHLYVPVLATSALVSVYGHRRTLINTSRIELFGSDVPLCSAKLADCLYGCEFHNIIRGYVITGDSMVQHVRALNLKGVQVFSYEITRSQSLYQPYTIDIDKVETEMLYASEGSVFPESLHGIFWMDQRGTAIPLPGYPDYRQVCPFAAEEVLVSWGEAAWNPETLCATGVSQYSGSPVSGQWAWLNDGTNSSASWLGGRLWNAEYSFCFRDSTMQFIDVFLSIPLNTLFPSLFKNSQIRFPVPVWMNNVGMAKKLWGWDRVTTIGPAWLRSIHQFFGADRWLPIIGGGCHYPVLPIVDGRGERTQFYDKYLAYVNQTTDCDLPSFTCPVNRGNGTLVIGRLSGPLPRHNMSSVG
eukprot:TRINITY_DN9957_c0_g2_i2.p1 TRINITY_DN9957_c0_g2~~TRINITY_DN9957_c0_g2_i2.p1  ORF type:complete len:477 (+),score=20.65 TRINITY_DN9957_c0_g2_i2:105-1535(+)